MLLQGQKDKLVGNLVEKFSQYDSFYVVEFSKIPVSDVNLIRFECYSRKIKYVIAKNTFFLRALAISHKELSVEIYKKFFKGSTAVFFINENNYNFPAQIIKKNQTKIHKFLLLKCAYIDGHLYEGELSLDLLSKIKSKKQLVAEVVSMLFLPLKKVLSGLSNKG